MTPKAKKDTPAPPKAKAKAKAKALKAKKAVLKGIQSHTHTHKHTHTQAPYVTYLWTAENTMALEAAQIPSEEHPQEKQSWPHCPHQVLPDC